MELLFFSSHHLAHIGPAYDLTFCEVRDNSLVVEWQKPVYTGSEPITGYHVEYAMKGTANWITANEKAASHRFLKVRVSLFQSMNHRGYPPLLIRDFTQARKTKEIGITLLIYNITYRLD